MNYKAGYTWRGPDGKMGDKFYPNRGRRTQPTKYDIEEMEVSASNDYFNAGPDRGLLKWPELKEVGYSIVPVVMVEIPEAWENEHRGRKLKMCATACPLINASPRCLLMDSEFVACGPDCPAGKGEG